MTLRVSHQRGFTLVEVIVSMVIGIILLAVCTSITVNTLVEGKRTRAQSEMARDGALAGQLLSQELRQAGLGVPNGRHIDIGYGTSNNPFYASLLVAGADEIGIVGDLARPDANYNAYGPLHNRPLPTNNLAWHTESNGTCVPDLAAGTSCSTAVTSLFFPGEAGCDAVGTGNFGDRTCPWGLRRVLPGERMIIVSGDGQWGHVGLFTPGTIDQAGPNLVLAARLSPGWVSSTPGIWPPPPPPAPAVTLPTQVGGQGWVATLDRLFFRYDGGTRTIQRIQCSGDPDPDNPNWPDETATTIPATLTFTPLLGTANTCGPSEIVARHVDSLTFTYFDAAGTNVPVRNTGALKRSVRRVGYRIQFRQTLDGRDVIYDVGGSVRLQNL